MNNQVHQRKTGIKRLLSAAKNSYRGLTYLLRQETAFQQEFVLFLCLLPVIFYVSDVAVEQVLLLSSALFVLIVEVLNTAIERTVDRISHDHHPLSGLAKDLASFAVLLSLLLAVSTWLIILW